MKATFRVKALEWGRGDFPFSLLTMQRNDEPHAVEFKGDAFWQWGGSPLRAGGGNMCWAQLLFDSLEGEHARALRAGEELVVAAHHPDYEQVERLWTLAQRSERETIALLKNGELDTRRAR